MSMKILVTALPDLKKIFPQRCHHLIGSLAEHHDVSVWCVNAWWLEAVDDETVSDTLEKVKFNYITAKHLHPVFQEMRILKALSSSDEKLDSFDVHLNFNALLAGARIIKAFPFPTLFDICDDLIHWVSTSPRIPALFTPVAKRIASRYLQLNINDSERITYSSELLAQKFHLPEKKSRFIPNGVDPVLFSKRECTYLKERLGFGSESFILGFTGYLGEWTYLDPVFQAIKTISRDIDIGFIILGSGTKLPYYQVLAEKLGISGRIRFTGNIPYRDIPDYISCMDICLLPFDGSDVSHNALPLKLFEYMACEKPVICSILDSVKTVVETNIVYFTDTRDLECKILDLYTDEYQRNELGKNGRTFVKINNYTWESISSQFEQVVCDVTEDYRRRNESLPRGSF